MSHNPLIIGQAQKDALRALRELAAAEPIDMLPVLVQIKTPDGLKRHLARMERFTIDLPAAFAVTFSIELNHPAGTMRHMSMSSARYGKLPHPVGLWMVAEELGFAGGLESCTLWKEDIGDGYKAINVVQPVATSPPAAA